MVSLVFTVLNEGGNISSLMEDILNSTRVPEEIVIVDGGSKDSTVSVIQGYQERCHTKGIRLKVIEKEGANIAEGRNIAIKAAKEPYIAVTDGGCRLDSTWLDKLVEPLVADRADFVGGFFRPLAHTRFQKVLAGLSTSTKPTAGFLPSSRSVAFTKSLWEKVGGYPEWLRWGEDTLFDRLCLKAGAHYEVASDALVFWEVRANFYAVVKQHFRYALGDGTAANFSAHHIGLQSVYWISLVASLACGIWGLTPILLYPLVLIIRRGAARPTDMPLAYGLAMTIQLSRIAGFILGFALRQGKRRRIV